MIPTTHEAQKEATRRWGPTGYAKRVHEAKLHRHFEVGDSRPGGIWGAGRSWDAAFKDADQRGGKK